MNGTKQNGTLSNLSSPFMTYSNKNLRTHTHTHIIIYIFLLIYRHLYNREYSEHMRNDGKKTFLCKMYRVIYSFFRCLSVLCFPILPTEAQNTIYTQISFYPN